MTDFSSKNYNIKTQKSDSQVAYGGKKAVTDPL